MTAVNHPEADIERSIQVICAAMKLIESDASIARAMAVEIIKANKAAAAPSG